MLHQRHVKFIPTDHRILPWVGAWLVLGALDFMTGFVAFSPARVLLWIGLLGVLVPWPIHWPPIRLSAPRWMGGAVLELLTLLGLAGFLNRAARGANLGDTLLFYQSVACGPLLCNPQEGVHWAAHISPGLVLLTPLLWLSAGWILLQLLHSATLVAWARLGGWAGGGPGVAGWLLTGALWAATYTQQLTFYDTRFAALGLLLVTVGILRNRWRWAGAGIALLSRETAALSLAVIAATRRWWHVAGVGVAWIVVAIVAERWAGGPISAGRFASCLPMCVSTQLAVDWPLKLAYTARLVSYAPAWPVAPIALGATPDLALTWISRDNVLYSLSWHYYPMALGILLGSIGRASPAALRWLLALCLWQAGTTISANLF